jgi:phage major head subunit gpT-like protein
MAIDITPEWLTDTQTRLEEKVSNAWQETLAFSFWRSLAIAQTQDTLKKQYKWMLESAEIRPTGSKGAELEFEELAEQAHELVAENFGTGLELFRNDIEDELYGDKASKWGSAAGSAAAYWPERQIINLLKNGKTKKGYDGKNFFATDHPVNPYDTTAGTYANLYTTRPLTAANVAYGVAQMLSVNHPGRAPRRLKPNLLIVDPSNQFAAREITGAEVIINASGNAAGSNIIKSAYGLGEPLVLDELASEAGVWYLAVPASNSEIGGAFLYSERKPFQLTAYSPMTQAELDRMNTFEWHMRGRNTAAYGDPYRIFRFEPT